LVAISGSGNSQKILNAVVAARDARMQVLTLSGLSADNKLRKVGDVNFYVPNSLYGLVGISHLAVCHALPDIASGGPFRDLGDSLRREDAAVTGLRRTGIR